MSAFMQRASLPNKIQGKTGLQSLPTGDNGLALTKCFFNRCCLYRNIMVDNSRIAGKRTAPEDLIDIRNGTFKVPEKAAGKP